MIFSRDTDDQRIQQSDWSRGTTSHNQPKVVLWNDTFLWWLSQCKNLRYLFFFSEISINYRETNIFIDSFQRYWWSKNPAIWLAERYKKPHPTKSGTLRCYFPLVIIPCENRIYQLIHSDDIDDVRFPQSNSSRGTTSQTQPKVVVWDATFAWWLSPCKNLRYWLILFGDIDDHKTL